MAETFAQGYKVDFKVDATDVAKIERLLEKMLKQLSVEKVQRILNYAAEPYISAVKRAAPKSDAVHYTYKTPKVYGKLRAANNHAVKYRTSAYHPGNLSNSFQALKLRKLKRSRRVIVGPKVVKRVGSYRNFGKGKSVNGWYAHFVEFGTKGTKRRKGQKAQGFQGSTWDTYEKIVMQKIQRYVSLLLSKAKA